MMATKLDEWLVTPADIEDLRKAAKVSGHHGLASLCDAAKKTDEYGCVGTAWILCAGLITRIRQAQGCA
jgi:hypothetical protein